jgi:hypothetical protein
MSSISYSSLFCLSITIESDDDCICFVRESIATFRNSEIWNVSCIFIDCDKSNWHAFFTIFLILYDSIHLWFSFLNDRFVFIFLMNNHIWFSITYSNESVLFWSTYLSWIFWVCANFFLMKSQIFFIFFAMIIAFYVKTRFLADNCFCESFASEVSKLIRDSNL